MQNMISIGQARLKQDHQPEERETFAKEPPSPAVTTINPAPKVRRWRPFAIRNIQSITPGVEECARVALTTPEI